MAKAPEPSCPSGRPGGTQPRQELRDLPSALTSSVTGTGGRWRPDKDQASDLACLPAPPHSQGETFQTSCPARETLLHTEPRVAGLGACTLTQSRAFYTNMSARFSLDRDSHVDA